MMQRRIYLGIYKRNQLTDVQAIDARQFAQIQRGVIISKKDYNRFRNAHPMTGQVAKAA